MRNNICLFPLQYYVYSDSSFSICFTSIASIIKTHFRQHFLDLSINPANTAILAQHRLERTLCILILQKEQLGQRQQEESSYLPRHLNKFCKLRITVALAYANNFAFINRLSNAAVIFAFKLKVVPMPHTPLSSKGRTTVPRSRTFIPLLLPIQQPVS